MDCSHPPCCKVPLLKKSFERSSCCIKTGNVGLKIFDKHRALIMLTAAALSMLSLILSIVPVVSVSKNNENVRTTSWTYGSMNGGGELFIGLQKIVLDGDGGYSQSSEWDDSSCDNFEGVAGEASFCEDCKAACDNSIGTAVTNVLTSIPTVLTDLQRSTRKGDLNCQKNMAIITGLISFFTTIVALASYANGCYRNLPDQIFGEDVTYEFGPGFVCLLVACLLKPIDIIVNILMPVHPHDDDLNEKFLFEDTADVYDLNLG